jgi:hypothetical protein
VVKKMIRNTVVDGRGRPPVDQKHSGGKCFGPIRGRHGGMYQEGPNSIVQGAKHALSFAVLGGGVGARSAEKDAAASQEGSSGIVEKLCAVIRLKTAHRIAELCVSVSDELDNMFVNTRFMTQREGPTVMGKIIDNHKIIFVARNTQNWRGPDITMKKFKRC